MKLHFFSQKMEKYDIEQEEQAVAWMEAVLGEPISVSIGTNPTFKSDVIRK